MSPSTSLICTHLILLSPHHMPTRRLSLSLLPSLSSSIHPSTPLSLSPAATSSHLRLAQTARAANLRPSRSCCTLFHRRATGPVQTNACLSPLSTCRSPGRRRRVSKLNARRTHQCDEVRGPGKSDRRRTKRFRRKITRYHRESARRGIPAQGAEKSTSMPACASPSDLRPVQSSPASPVQSSNAPRSRVTHAPKTKNKRRTKQKAASPGSSAIRRPSRNTRSSMPSLTPRQSWPPSRPAGPPPRFPCPWRGL